MTVNLTKKLDKIAKNLTVLDSNFLEANLTLALQQNTAVSNQTEVDRYKDMNLK